MRARTRLVAVVAVLAGVVACGSSGSNGTSGSGSSPPSPTASATPSVAAALLTPSDVGRSWTAGHEINAADLAAVAQLPCEATLDPVIAKRLTGVAGVQFDPAARSYRHLIELVTTGEARQLDGDLSKLFAAIESCAGTGTLKVTPLALPHLGDQQAAYTMTQPGPAGSGTALSLRSAYVRVGSAAVVLGLADFQASAQGRSQISDDTFVSLVERAVAKLKAAS